ncbi:MAG TPA: ATP-binding protein [Bryobacteraceae bacterium]|nr:ATP-binding protein [Bryobacteraceae bacterium]
MKRVAMSWSSGKDSAWALGLLKRTPGVEVAALITTFNTTAGRVAMHAVRRRLVELQAERAGLPLWPVELPWPCANSVYEERMAEVCRRAGGEGLSAIAFGDLFLRDVREYRERQLQGTGLEPLFPLWEIPTARLAADMIRGGLNAKVTCVDPKKLDRAYAGRDFDSAFVAELPPTVDPCGENGEFHTFVYDAPVFSGAIGVETGEIVERDGFVFADVLEA